jgi:formylglycine-generating enzyme required for sulfatase activity
MFASKNTFRLLMRLIFLSAFVWVSHSSAQQQPAELVENQDSAEERHIERLDEASPDEWEMDLALPSAATVASPGGGDVKLPDADQNKKLQKLLANMAASPGNARVLAQLNALLADVLVQANSMMDEGLLDETEQLFLVIHSIDPGFRGLSRAKKRLKVLREAEDLVITANAALESQRILQPENDNAFYYFNQALRKNPRNQAAKLGLLRVQTALVGLALESARELDFETTEAWLLEASEILEDQQLIEGARIEVATFRQERAAELEENAINAMNSGEFILADFNIIDLIALGGQEERLKTLRPRLVEARLYGGFEPGQVISDELLKSGGKAPEIIVITPGSFRMGSRDSAEGAADNEKPRHRVTIERGFGLGIREVSVAEFRLFIENTSYRTAAERSGRSNVYDEAAGRLTKREGVNWQHDYTGEKAEPGMPVMHVSVLDALAYVKWLATETEKSYRLPSEAEYEYVARAGGKATYWWGEGSPLETVENLTGDRDKSPTRRKWTTAFKKYGDGHWGPAVTGSIGKGELIHPMGIYDIAGNVSEWTEDCWHNNYVKAPVDGSAWVNPGCNRRVVRGGYWAGSPLRTRAAFRIAVDANAYGPVVGFRIARNL